MTRPRGWSPTRRPWRGAALALAAAGLHVLLAAGSSLEAPGCPHHAVAGGAAVHRVAPGAHDGAAPGHGDWDHPSGGAGEDDGAPACWCVGLCLPGLAGVAAPSPCAVRPLAAAASAAASGVPGPEEPAPFRSAYLLPFANAPPFASV